MQQIKNDDKFKVGFFAIVGKPNAGKSSILNKILGQKVSIVSYKPQTTRNKIVGICTDDTSQLVFVDTPGFIQPDNMLNKFMEKQINLAIEGVDGIIFVLDCSKPASLKELESIEQLSKKGAVIVALNKVDLVDYQTVYPLIKQINELDCVTEIVSISALTGQNLDVLRQACTSLCTESVKHYDDTQFTDRTERFMVGEIVREKILLYFQQEIPHGVGVSIEKFEETKNIVKIGATIVCIKSSHKPILLGKDGLSIKKIGVEARKDIEDLLQKKVRLELFVKVRKNWKNNQNYLSDIGYDKSEG